MKPWSRVVATLLGTIPLGLVRAQADWTFTDLQPLGSPFSACYGISENMQVGWATPVGSTRDHAYMWNGTPSAVDLNPPGFLVSIAIGIYGESQVGLGFQIQGGSYSRALLWQGTPESAVDLTPAGSYQASALAAYGDTQCGSASGLGAVVWHGSANSVVSLNPAGAEYSGANSISGNLEGGVARYDGIDHATIWTGTADSAIDLHPDGFDSSNILGVSPDYQVGYATKEGSEHAIVWSGTAASAVDLNPEGFSSSRIRAVSGKFAVGSASNSEGHALLWNLESGIDFDLNSVLPAGYSSADAASIDCRDGMIRIGGTARNDLEGNLGAILWTEPVPEPNPGFTIGVVLVADVARRKCRRRVKNRA
jgi:hypothetical protein